MKKIKIMHFVSGIGNDGVAQVLTNYTGRMNQKFPIEESIVYQHKADARRLKLEQELGNDTYRIPFKAKHPIRNLKATYKLIKNKKPDIVEAHMNLVNFFPLFVAWMLKVPVRISHSHIAQDADNINSKLAPWFKKLNIIFANTLVACGEEAGKYMYGNRKFHIIYNAIDQSEYKFNEKYRDEIRHKYNISDTTVVIGNIGRITKQKNQKFLIDVFTDYLKENSDAVLFIIGNGELENKLDQYIKERNIEDKVIRIEGVTSTEKFYSVFDVFLLPSLYEGLPVVAIEAQASGVKILMSDNIDPTVKYTNSVSFLPLNKGTKPWVHNIIKKYKRAELCEDNKYNIEIQYVNLYKFYKKMRAYKNV